MESALLAFLIPGLKELVLVAIVALVLYGRSGTRVLKATKYGRTIEPWLNLVRVRQPPPRRGAGPPPRPPKRRGQGRWFWALALTAAAAVAAWVATRLVILSGSGAPH